MAANCERLAGITGLAIDGVSYMVVSDVTWSPGRWKRETLVGLDSVHGFSEVPLQGYIEATLRDSGSILVEDFAEMRCVEVQVQLANGKIVAGSNMWNTSANEVRAAEGTFQVRFDGVTVAEQAPQ
jgi:Phage tail tube protein